VNLRHAAGPVPRAKFQCQDCGQLLATKTALKKHVTLHKPPGLSCPICGKLFHNQAYLTRHALSQHGNRSDQKHQCDMCDKGFNNKQALEGHRNWHLNLKPFQCRWCDRTYQNSPNCSAHERKSHRDEYEAMKTQTMPRLQVRETKLQSKPAQKLVNSLLIDPMKPADLGSIIYIQSI